MDGTVTTRAEREHRRLAIAAAHQGDPAQTEPTRQQKRAFERMAVKVRRHVDRFGVKSAERAFSTEPRPYALKPRLSKRGRNFRHCTPFVRWQYAGPQYYHATKGYRLGACPGAAPQEHSNA